jgi:alpha-ketoglutarate-dependent taurine dioxygenase
MKRVHHFTPPGFRDVARIPAQHGTQHAEQRTALHPLDGPFGMGVVGIDLSRPVPVETRKALNQALVEHQVLLFRNQHLGDAHLSEVASWFGNVRVLPGGHNNLDERIPGVRHLTNLGSDGRPVGEHPDPFSREWHADGAWMPSPARATLLYAIEVPREGGATQFADMYGGLEAFDESERQRLATLEVIHDVELARVLRYGRAITVNKHLGRRQKLRRWLRFMRRMLPGRATVHPVIRTCRDSGRPAIVLGCDAWRVCGMGWRRGMREVAELTLRSVRPERVLTHHWQAGDLVVWDNRSLLHRVNDYDFKHDARVMRQVVIAECTS